jgi:hypothetical protein
MIKGSLLVRWAATLAKEVAIVCLSAGIVIVAMRMANSPGSSLFNSRPRQQVMQGSLVSIGSMVTLRTVDFTTHPWSFVLVSSPYCHYCVSSESFHAKIIAASKRENIPFHVVVPDRREAAPYLASVGVSESDASEWKDLDVSVEGTPTLFAVNSKGAVRRIWTGRVPSDKEGELLKLVHAPSLLDSEPAGVRQDQLDVGNARRNGRVQVIEPRERDRQTPREGVIVMPVLEIATRAPFELDKTKLQVVDCSNVSPPECQGAVARLRRLGFRVATEGDGSSYSSCESLAVVRPKESLQR